MAQLPDVGELTVAGLTHRQRVAFLVAVSLVIVAATLVAPPVAQPERYHDFADQRAFFGIPNFLDTASNIALLVAGVAGLRRLIVHKGRAHFVQSQERITYLTFFAAVSLTCFGSIYYHLAPSNATLVWDRLPMAVGFASFLAIVVAERINVRAAIRLLFPLVAIGVASVWFWWWSAQRGAENVLPYAAFQFGGALLVLLTIWLFPSRHGNSQHLIVAFGWYALAKIAEALDQQIFALGGMVSGHSLKHVLAAIAAWQVCRMLAQRILDAHGEEKRRHSALQA